MLFYAKKLIVQTKEEDKQNDQRKDISDVYAHPFLDLQAFSGVGFFCEVFQPHPHVWKRRKAGTQENQVEAEVTYQGNHSKSRTAPPDTSNPAPAPYVVTENAWQGKKDDSDGIHKTGFSTPAGKLHTTGNNIFKYSQDGGSAK